MSKISLDKILETTNEEIVSDYSHVDFARILNELCYKLPKGYPTVVDGMFTEREEIVIINEALEEEGLPTLPLPEVEVYLPEASTQPNTKDPEFKEGMVVYFLGLPDKNFNAYLNYFENPTPNAKLPDYIAPKKKGYYKGSDLVAVENGIKYLYANSQNFKNQKALGGYIEPFSTAYAIRQMFGRQNADRGPLFAALKEEAAAKATDLIGEKVPVDKWCPADMFVYAAPVDELYFDEKFLNTGPDSINSSFVIDESEFVPGKIVGISLKESQARAGKAKSFTDVLTRKQNYDKAPQLSEELRAQVSILYHTEEAIKDPSKVYYISEVCRRLISLKDQTPAAGLLKVIKPIVVSKFGSVLGKNKAKEYQKANLEKVGSITPNQQKAISRELEVFAENIQEAVLKVYRKEKGIFTEQLNKLNYEVAAKKEAPGKEKKIKAISRQCHIQLKKAGCYQIASWFMTGFNTNQLAIPKEFKTLSVDQGVFVALTAYAIGMGGVSPDFLKAKGAPTPTGGGVEEFFGSGYLTLDPKTQVIVNDTDEYSGFQVSFFTAALRSAKKNKIVAKYKTILDFRYSGDALFIEVGKLDRLK